MPKALWNGKVIAESDQTELVEGNHYFPPGSLASEYFTASNQTTVCGWKGTANYYDILVDGDVNEGAAWYYHDPRPEAATIKDFVAFWKGVKIES